jgi:hypothetical protein
MAEPPGPQTVHSEAHAAGGRVDWDDDIPVSPEYGDSFDEHRSQISAPWLHGDEYFQTQIEIMSDDVNTSLLRHRLPALRPRMQWWFLTPGVRVYGLGMERWDSPTDRAVYPVHPSRYTITTEDTPPLTDDRQENDFGFNWLISLDGAVLTLEGGRCVLDIPVEAEELRDLPETHWFWYRWEVYAEERSPWKLLGNTEHPATVFHPDIPVWGHSTYLGPRYHRRAPTWWFVPPVVCRGATGPCPGAERVGIECAHLWPPVRSLGFPSAHTHALHAPVALELGAHPRSELRRGGNPRSVPVAAHADRTLWSRGDYPFEVSITPPQFFNAEARPEAH